MAQKNLGQVAIINRGAYASNVSYAVLNTVTHRGGTFMCIKQCTVHIKYYTEHFFSSKMPSFKTIPQNQCRSGFR